MACICGSGVGPIWEVGAQIFVQATGVGAPFSLITVTMASPMPSCCSNSSSS